MMNKSSHMGKILRVDLTNQNYDIEKIDEDILFKYIGGRGLGTYYLYKILEAKADPLSEKNILIFTTGPLNGTIAPTSGKFGIVTKSPLTNGYLDSYAGGDFGNKLKSAGFDLLILEGKSPFPVLLRIENESVEFIDASNLWGKTMSQTNNFLKENYKGFSFVAIGPAGERLSPISSIFCGTRSLSRGGSGAVMGSKNVKAIAVNGNRVVDVANKEIFEEGVKEAYRAVRMNSTIKRLSQYGTVQILRFINAAGGLPTRNFQTGVFEEAETLFDEKWKAEVFVKDTACPNCPISCSKVAHIKSDTLGEIVLDGPDYETIFSLGTNCGISDKQAIVYANYLCDEYGIDTISTGGIIAFVMEAFEKGIIDTNYLDGLEPKWGDVESFIKLVEKICKAEGVGSELQKGVKYLSRKIPGTSNFAMHVKGLEMPAYLPRAGKGIALSYAVTERGACHLHGTPISELLGEADPKTYEGKAELFLVNQVMISIIDSAILCYFTHGAIRLKEYAKMFRGATGFEYDVANLQKFGRRLSTLSRLFNIREGKTKDEDNLPRRSTEEPLTSGPSKGETIDLDVLLEDYYTLMGWDKNGVPTEGTLKALEIDF